MATTVPGPRAPGIPAGTGAPGLGDPWARQRRSCAADWSPAQLLVAKRGRRVSVVLPARDEAATVGPIVREVIRLGELVDEIIVVDSRSRDCTAEVAADAGARVVSQDGAGSPALEGKGGALLAGLAASQGDLVVFLDADLRDFDGSYVPGLLGPLLTDPDVAFVKARYRRPAAGADHGGGRVTELLARPLLNLFWPELAGFAQPLAGEYAARRQVLERVPFVSGYGVDLGLLLDVYELVGLDGLAEVDLGLRRHRHQDLDALGRMSAQILSTAWTRLQRRGWVAPHAAAATVLIQFPGARTHGVAGDVAVREAAPLRAPDPVSRARRY